MPVIGASNSHEMMITIINYSSTEEFVLGLLAFFKQHTTPILLNKKDNFS